MFPIFLRIRVPNNYFGMHRAFLSVNKGVRTLLYLTSNKKPWILQSFSSRGIISWLNLSWTGLWTNSNWHSIMFFLLQIKHVYRLFCKSIYHKKKTPTSKSKQVNPSNISNGCSLQKCSQYSYVLEYLILCWYAPRISIGW